MAFCSKCGAEAPENIKFCPKCGNTLQGGQSPTQPNHGTGRKKKSLLIKGGIAIAVLVVLCAIALPKLFGKSKAIAVEIGREAGTWQGLQLDYMVKHDRVGDCSQIGYTPPGNGRTEFFTYKCGVQDGLAIWMAENNVDLDKCKAGNQWVVTVDKNMEIAAKLLGGKDCEALTPYFCKLATSGKCTDN